VYWWIQPRGFSFGSRSFFEHEVIVPAVFAISLCAVFGSWKKKDMCLLATTAILGFWIPVFAVVGLVIGGNFRFLAQGLLACALVTVAVFIIANTRTPVRWLLIAAGLVVGTALGAGFVHCTSPPPATTHPANRPIELPARVEGPAVLKSSGMTVSVEGKNIFVRGDGMSASIRPSMRFEAESPEGHWTVFRSCRFRLPPWKVARGSKDALILRSSTKGMSGSAVVRIVDGKVRILFETNIEETVHAHLSSAVSVTIWGEARVRGLPWKSMDGDSPAEFIAFRDGRMEFLRSRSDEKGPFETIAGWEAGDPEIEIGGWRVRVLGWADQASREESPTAGWGVSQGAIEYYRSTLIWSLASTSVGRGWHAVATKPGRYVFEIVLSR
jgi:hypothetical protein